MNINVDVPWFYDVQKSAGRTVNLPQVFDLQSMFQCFIYHVVTLGLSLNLDTDDHDGG